MQSFESKKNGNPFLAELLLEPPLSLPLEKLADHWKRNILTFVFKRPALLEEGDWLNAAVRGAWGRQLKKLADEGRKQHEQASAFDVFFCEHARMPGGKDIPKPFVLYCKTTPSRIYLQITLFGFACYWRDDAMEAMLRVMRPVAKGGEGGVSLKEKGRQRAAWEPLDVYWQEEMCFDCPPAKELFAVVSQTPLILGSGKTKSGSYQSLFFKLATRLSGLARWQGVALKDDFSTLRRLGDEIILETLYEPKIAPYMRRSRNSGSYDHNMVGVHISLLIKGCPLVYWPVFAIGTTCHMGASTVHGHGKYVVCEP